MSEPQIDSPPDGPQPADGGDRAEPRVGGSRRSALLLVGSLVVLAAAIAVWLWLPIARAYIDLLVYRLGGRTWLDGNLLYGPLPPVLNGEELPFTYPPLAAIVFAPMAMLAEHPAAAVMFALSTAALAGTLWLVLARIRPDTQAITRLTLVVLVTAAALFIEPVRETLGFGQVNLILMFLVAADILVDKPWWPRGTLIGIAASVKLTPAAFILYFVAGRQWRPAITVAMAAAVATGIGFLLARADSVQYWLRGTVVSTNRIGPPQFSSNQSIKGMVIRFGWSDSATTVVWLAASAVVVAMALVVMRRMVVAGDPLAAMVVNAATVLLISPVSWSHHWVWIVPAIVLAVDTVLRRRQSGAPLPWWPIAAIVVVVVAYYVGPHWTVPAGYARELHWNWWQTIVGDFYGWTALAGLLVLLLRYRGPRERNAREVSS